MVYRNMKDFLNEDLTYGEKQEKIKKDMECLRLSEPHSIHLAKDMLSRILDRYEQKYNDIIDTIKIQNEVDAKVGKTERPKFTNLEYLNGKRAHDVSLIKDKWNKIKQSIIKDEEV